MTQGNKLLEEGNPEAAAEYFEKVVELEPGNAMAITRLGTVRHQQQALDVAIEHYLHALQLNPYLPLAQFNLGVLFQEQKQFAEAEDFFRTVIRLQQNFPLVHAHLGYVLAHQGKQEEAVSAYKHGLISEPDAPDIHYHLALALTALGKTDEAEACLRTALRHRPNHAEACLRLGELLQAKGNYTEAEACYLDAINHKTGYAEAYRGLATLLSFIGRQDEAVAYSQEALRFKPDYADAHIAMAATLLTLQKPDEAMKHAVRALDIEPDNINAIALVANISTFTGDMQAAYQRLRPLLDKGIENYGTEYINVALTFSIVSNKVGRQDDAIALLEKLLQDPSLPETNRINLLFNLGKLYDSAGLYDKAFSYYKQGNDLKPLVYDATNHAAGVEVIINTFSPDLMMSMPRASVHSDRPVFVVGMARSGTSLVEQILSTHPQIYGAGELRDIIQIPHSLPVLLATEKQYPLCLRLLTQDKLDQLAQEYLDNLDNISPDTRRVIDKMPGNFMHLGLIELLFPNARIIHCNRDPLDTCLSCYFQDFSRGHAYSYNMENLGAFYLDYRKIMQHWKSLLSIPVFEVKYEELILNQEAVSRSLVEFCGLDWDERCLDFHKTDRFVGTASFDQVRQPIYKKSVRRWKNYRQHLGSLRKALQLDHNRPK